MTRIVTPSCCVLALALPLGALAQRNPLGSEFQVNTFTPYSQRAPAVAGDANGDFVVVWAGRIDLSGYGISATRFSSAGTPLAGEFRVNDLTLGQQTFPSVSVEADGDFVVVWQAVYQDTSAYGISARRFSSAGAPIASEFQVNDFTSGQQVYPSVAASASGDFVVAWHSDLQDGSSFGVFARRFSSAGVRLASEFQVNTYTIDLQRFASVAAGASGDFVVAWHSNLQDGASWGVFARRFSSAGAALASEFQVNTRTAGVQFFPSVAASPSGDFVVAWASYPGAGGSYDIFARRFSSAGAPLASEFQVNTFTPSTQSNPSVVADTDGDFVVSWESLFQDGSAIGVFARRFSSAGAPLTNDFQVNTYTSSYQRFPSVAASAAGDFVVVWLSIQDGAGYGVFAQRFAHLAALDIDGNGSIGPLTDGLLVLRFLFGFTGTTLTGGAIGDNCTRCSVAAIESYLAGLGVVLDVDGNTANGPLTDGLLALRFMFGFTGATLVNGALGDNCTRCSTPSIEAYLVGLTT